MDSNSTLAPNPHGRLQKEERSLGKRDHAVTAYHDNHSESALHTANSPFPRPPLRVGSQIEELPKKEKEQRPVSFSPREEDVFHDGLFITVSQSRPRNPWATFGSMALPLLLLLAVVVIPLFHAEKLPKRERLTMLYMPPAAAASNDTRLSVPTLTSRYTQSTMRIPTAAHMTQAAPSPPLDPPSGVVGGVPGGIVGGISNAVLSDVLRSTSSAPVLAKTPAATPKRIHVPAPMIEANLVHDVAPKYPLEAGRARIEGTVVLFAVIAKDGSVEGVRVKSGLPVLAQAAIEAVRQWRYRPYLLNGEPVEVDSQITINFTLAKG